MHHSFVAQSALLSVTVVLVACTATGPGNQTSSAMSSVQSAAMANSSSAIAENIFVSTPNANQPVKSPLTVRGEARGTWYFEASFPVRLFDANGVELAVVPAQALSDWMTTDFVPFEAVLTFAAPSTSTGTLVLQKDNPSGEPQYDASITIPIQF